MSTEVITTVLPETSALKTRSTANVACLWLIMSLGALYSLGNELREMEALGFKPTLRLYLAGILWSIDLGLFVVPIAIAYYRGLRITPIILWTFPFMVFGAGFLKDPRQETALFGLGLMVLASVIRYIMAIVRKPHYVHPKW